MSFSEVNVCWKNISSNGQLKDRTNMWFNSLHLNTAYTYQTKITLRRLHGGNALCVGGGDYGTHRVYIAGSDIAGLRQWTWTKFRGKEGNIMKVYNIYISHALRDQENSPHMHNKYNVLRAYNKINVLSKLF